MKIVTEHRSVVAHLRTGILVVLALLVASAMAHAADPSPTDLAWLRGEVGDGALAYESAGTVYLTELSTGSTATVGSGTKAEFSPDSSKLAWIDGTTAKGRMRRGSDTSVHLIAEGVTSNAGVHWISNTEVVLVRSGKWRRVSLAGNEAEVPALTALGLGGTETDVKLGSDGVWSYVNGETWKTSDGQSGGTGGTCSGSLSPDGKSVTGLLHEHKECALTRARSGGVSGKLTWVYDFTGSKGFDNHRWSSNDGRFVVCQDEKYNSMFVIKVGGTRGTRMGNSGSGEMYGDFTVGDGQGDPWPGSDPDPVLTEVEVTPANTIVVANGQITLTAQTKDQLGRAIAATLSWQTSGGGSVNPGSTSGTTHTAVFTSGGATGTFTITASGGGLSGQSIIEVSATPPVNQAPEVDAGVAQTVQVDQPVFLDGSATDDGLPLGTLELSWSMVSGPATAEFDDPTDPQSRVTFAAPGSYVLRFSADDGALETSADVTIEVEGQPSISIIAPQSGQQIAAGQPYRIKWSTVNLTDVQIDYSLDDGQTWGNITDSVDTLMDGWGDYPWDVPEEASDTCRIMIAGYYGDAPTQSGVFAISSAVTGGLTPRKRIDPLGLAGGCALGGQRTSSPTAPALVFLLLLLAARRCGRRSRGRRHTPLAQ